MKILLRSTAAAIGLFASGATFAALPFGDLAFRDRVASVGASEVIDVWMRFTLDPASPALDFTNNPLTGFDPADLPTQGEYFDPVTQQYVTANFASIDRAYLNTYFSCDDTFTNGCNGPDPKAYTYNFFLTSQPGKPSANFLDQFSLQPGQSYEYVFAQFTPTNGAAPAGTYQFFGTGLTLNFGGVDADGHALNASIDLGTTCAGGSTSACAFTRTVTAVPEPSSYALMVVGLGLVAGIARRGQRRTSRQTQES